MFSSFSCAWYSWVFGLDRLSFARFPSLLTPWNAFCFDEIAYFGAFALFVLLWFATFRCACANENKLHAFSWECAEKWQNIVDFFRLFFGFRTHWFWAMKHFLWEFSALPLSHLAPLDCIGEWREVVLTTTRRHSSTRLLAFVDSSTRLRVNAWFANSSAPLVYQSTSLLVYKFTRLLVYPFTRSFRPPHFR